METFLPYHGKLAKILSIPWKLLSLIKSTEGIFRHELPPQADKLYRLHHAKDPGRLGEASLPKENPVNPVHPV